MRDMGVLAAGNLMDAARGIGQQLQKQIGQTGIPVYNVANACATGATALRTAIMAVKAGECDYGLAVGVEKLAGAGLLGRRQPQGRRRRVWTPHGRYGAVAPVDGRIGTETMPGVFAQIGMEYGHKYGGASFELFARISEKNHAHSTLNPLAAYSKQMHARRDHERRHDRLPEHPADVLGELRRCRGGRGGRRDAKLKTLDRRAAAPADQGVGIGAHDRPVAGGLPGPARRQHAHTQRGHAGLRAGRRVGPTTSTSSSCTTASPPPSWCTTTTSCCAPRASAVDFFESGATWRDGRRR